MSQKSEVRCETQRCIDTIAQFGENYHGVYEEASGQSCERCGAKRQNGVWSKTCAVCKKQTDELFGLFVPHRCKDCQEAERVKQEASGRRCGMCRQLYMNCCC